MPYLSDRRTPLRLEEIRDYIHHNTYLSLLTETGLIGLGLFIAVLACWIRLGWQLSRDDQPRWMRAHGVLLLGALTTYCTQMMFHEVSYTAIDNSLIFFLAGIANGLVPMAARTNANASAKRRSALASATGSDHSERVPLASAVCQCESPDRSQRHQPEAPAGEPAAAAPARHLPILLKLRSFVQTMLRHHPRLYTFARRTYGRLTFALKIPHESDFRLFAALEGTGGLFIDVGANSGQSARSLRIFNRSLDILSFEPNRLLEPDLRFTRRLLGRSFRYRMQGLGSTNRRTMLYVPLVGPTPQTPWATADRQLLENSRPQIERELGQPFEIAEVPIVISRGDDMRFQPVVVKIDVEGFELDVLQGLEQTLEAYEPLLMIERNLGSAAVATWLEARGYHLWVYDATTNRLLPPDDAPAPTNYIACTPNWLARCPQISRLIAERRSNSFELAQSQTR